MSSPLFILIKLLVTSGIIVLITELVKISGKLGAFIAALPTVTILVLIWMYIEGQPQEKISNHAWFTLWYVIPTLPMFMVFPYLYTKFSFWAALLFASILTLLCFAVFVFLVRRFGIELI